MTSYEKVLLLQSVATIIWVFPIATALIAYPFFRECARSVCLPRELFATGPMMGAISAIGGAIAGVGAAIFLTDPPHGTNGAFLFLLGVMVVPLWGSALLRSLYSAPCQRKDCDNSCPPGWSYQIRRLERKRHLTETDQKYYSDYAARLGERGKADHDAAERVQRFWHFLRQYLKERRSIRWTLLMLWMAVGIVFHLLLYGS